MKKWLGIGAIDLAIQAVLTICVIGMGADRVRPEVQDAYVFGWLGVSVLVLAVRRHFALKKQVPEEARGEIAEQHMAELEMRLSDLEMSQTRLTELEERLDFAERVLTQKQDQRQEMLGNQGAN